MSHEDAIEWSSTSSVPGSVKAPQSGSADPSEPEESVVSSKSVAVHWIGGINHPRGTRLPGWPCCCTGERCERLADNDEACTRIPERVTCKGCLRWMAKDVNAKRWGLGTGYD